jgi:hypothetical protein
MTSRTIEISVTSVLQTTAGKMIFGRFDERVHGVHDKSHSSDRSHNSQRDQPVASPQPAEPRGSGVGAGGG